MTTLATQRFRVVALALLVAASAIMSALILPRPASSQATTPVTGYAWSDTIGWISFNCATGGPTGNNICATSNYGVTVDASGNMAGYAWSDSVGWIKFGGLSSFPTGGGTTAANATMSGTTLSGWARACAGTSAGDCSSMTSRSDGWDGWIALSGTGYGPMLSGGSFSGYSWGDVNVGWISWSGVGHSVSTTYLPCAATQGYVCSPNNASGNSVYTAPSCAQTTDVCANHGAGWFCATDNGLCTAPPAPSYTNPGNALSARPSLVKKGETTKLSWSVQDATSCTVTGNGDSWTGLSSATASCTKSGTMCVSSAINDVVTYRIHCVGDGGTLDGAATVTLVPSWKEK